MTLGPSHSPKYTVHRYTYVCLVDFIAATYNGANDQI